MPATVLRLLPRGLVTALVLVVLAVQPVAAADWGADTKLASGLTSDHELVRTGARSAVMLWQRGGDALLVKRTLDGGRTWTAPQTVATSVGLGSAIAASGARVDLVYARTVLCGETGSRVSRLYYRRSLDGGATWRSPVALTSACSQVVEPDVARSADGQVTVAWVGLFTGRIFLRTSRDGGAAFGAPTHVATTSARDRDATPGARWVYSAKPDLAIGAGGVTYLAYTSARDTISVRRSLDRGTTWSGPRSLTSRAVGGQVTIVAAGSRAIVGYTVDDAIFRAVYRTTSDRGATWSSQRSVVALTGREFSTEPEFALQGGTLAVIVKHGTPGASPVWYRESPDWGSTWTAPARVSLTHPGGRADPEPAGIALLDEAVVAGYAENGDVEGLWARRAAR